MRRPQRRPLLLRSAPESSGALLPRLRRPRLEAAVDLRRDLVALHVPAVVAADVAEAGQAQLDLGTALDLLVAQQCDALRRLVHDRLEGGLRGRASGHAERSAHAPLPVGGPRAAGRHGELARRGLVTDLDGLLLAGVLRAAELQLRAARDVRDVELLDPQRAGQPDEVRPRVGATDARRLAQLVRDLHRAAGRGRAADLDRVPLAGRDDARGAFREAGLLVVAGAVRDVGRGVLQAAERDDADHLVEGARGRADRHAAPAVGVEGGPDRVAVLAADAVRVGADVRLGRPALVAGAVRLVHGLLDRVRRRVGGEEAAVVVLQRVLLVVEDQRIQIVVAVGRDDRRGGGGERGRDDEHGERD